MPYLEEQELEDTMDDSKPEVSVIDVYDIASEIGKEFEKMIDVYGTDAVINLMPKVINALEQLEGLATRNERENNQIQELKARIAQLEKDKIGKAEDRHRFEMELEQIEEHWREESRDLEAMVSHLQEENRKLSSLLAEKKQAEKSPDPGALLSPEVDMALLQRLRGLVDRLKDQLRQRDRELQTKQTEVESLSSQVEQLTIISRELRRKQRLGQTQIHTLIDERADFLAQLHDQQREVQALRQRLGLAEKENEDLSISAQDSPDLTNKVIYDKDDPNRPRFTTQELKDILHERNELKARVSDLEDELEMYRPKDPPKRSTAFVPSLFPLHRLPLPQMCVADEEFASSALSVVVIPPANCGLEVPLDSNTSELEQVRSAPVSSTPENAGFMNPRLIKFSTPNINGIRTPCTSPSKGSSESTPKKVSSVMVTLSPDGREEELIVEGPLPQEPDDAPWKKSDSGIRKLFKYLTNVTTQLI
ncbi:RILP-like protein-like protein [Frankliniella fusca]|uniref:RILP-like protein-like protein n=1 Tax=Frankliniella fusca TaxID=407009 RepID=A0AAE1HTV3_9NEOP|nr:RILP-like protein-like protein [Frankliniella fusca]